MKSSGSGTTLVFRPVRTGSTLSTKSRATFNRQHQEPDVDNNHDKKPKHSRSHYKLIHQNQSTSLLTYEKSRPLPKFSGFQNLAMIVLIVSNLRLVVENYQNYGFLKTIITLGLSKQDSITAGALTATVPIHLFVALLIEKAAASSITASLKDKKSSAKKQTLIKHLWTAIAFLHLVNVWLVLVISSYTVYFHMFNPLVGTICVFHAIVLCLKVASYALTNRDLRDSLVDNTPVPSLYNECKYPNNLTLSNLVYFWWAPTLVYQPVYPRSPTIRPRFLAARVCEILLTAVLIWFLSSQYATPILEKSLVFFEQKNFLQIAERLMKLSTVSIVIWLLGFFLIFQSYLNLLAELLRFGDRAFYEDFWNCGSVGAYWKMWNKPVHNYFIRHLYIPLLKRGWTNSSASTGVFFISALLHEIVVGIPTHNIIWAAFTCMLLQVPLVLCTAPLEKMGRVGKTMGNCIFWFSFFLGQPTAVLLYYFAWNLKYGSLSPM